MYTANAGPAYNIQDGGGLKFTMQLIPEPSSLILAGIAGTWPSVTAYRRRRTA